METQTDKIVDKFSKINVEENSCLNVIFVGHVDAGKSTLCGRMLVDLGLIEDRVLEKYKKDAADCNRSSWYLSWCMDLNPEEREKGKTQEMSLCSFNLKNGLKINIVDSPGHKNYVNEMIDGAARADVGVLIVSARTGEFEAGFLKGGQTKEHLKLLKASGVENLIVLINKMDECSWSQERYSEIKSKVDKFVKALYKKEIEYVAVSGYTGENVVISKNDENQTFINVLEKMNTNINNSNNKLAVVSVLERVKASSTSFFVKIEQGSIIKGNEYFLISQNAFVTVTEIKDDDDIDLESTERVKDVYKIKIKGDMFVGDKLVDGSMKDDYKAVSEIVAQIGIYGDKLITIGYSAVLHINGIKTGMKINRIYNTEKKSIKVARKGEKVLVQMSLEDKIVVNRKEKKRFCIRDEEMTVAMGEIVKINC